MNTIRLLIAFAEPDRQSEMAVEVPAGTTLQQALALLETQVPVVDNGVHLVAHGVWGKVRAGHYVLREGDRIELYRPLKADPKQARRRRASLQSPRGS